MAFLSAVAGAGCNHAETGEVREPTGSGPPYLEAAGDSYGQWTFDDCSANSTSLQDASGNSFQGVRSTGTSCAVAPGEDGLGRNDAVAFQGSGSVVSIAHAPAFQFDSNLTVSTWVHPASITTSQVLVQKATSSQSSFVLAIKNSRAEFSIQLRSGATITARGSLLVNRWSHVAGLYDGAVLSLFVNGASVAQVPATGLIRNVTAPIRIGSGNGGAQSFVGRLDNVRVAWFPEGEFDIAPLACVRRTQVTSISHATSGPVQPDTTVFYDVQLKNNDFGLGCPAQSDYTVFLNQAFPVGFQTDLSALPRSISKGGTGSLRIGINGNFDATPGVYRLPFLVLRSLPEELAFELVYELATPTGCFVRPARELMITAPSVAQDPVRTTFANPGSASSGVWTFNWLMQNMAPTAAEAPAMVERLLKTWLTNQTVNGFTVAARPDMQTLLLDTWPRTANGQLDLKRAPFRLQAIVNRMDLRQLAQGHAGEGRFVFAHESLAFFSLIIEYRLPAKTASDVRDWAARWHALGNLAVPSEAYNVALEQITRRFAGRNAEPGRPNGSALSSLRTNEVALGLPWELRSFKLQTNGFVPLPVALTPDERFDGTSTLASYINANEAAILAERHTVPERFNGAPFLAGAIFNNQTPWTAPGINNSEARHKFSINTCNGCHGLETGTTEFLQIHGGDENGAQLGPFLTGVTVTDPVSGVSRSFNDIRRRRLDFVYLVCGTSSSSAVATESTSRSASSDTSAITVESGIQRVH